MIGIRYDKKNFNTTLRNTVEYSLGFLDGAKMGTIIFNTRLAQITEEALKQYIDIKAKANPESLHHVYEWNQTGSPSARLFDLRYTVSKIGLSVNSTFRQSRSVNQDMTTPFYDKARIMENGIPVTIRPTKSQVLKFNGPNGEIFTRRPVKIENPGGEDVYKGFESVFDEFMLRYFKQSFLRSSGLFDYIQKPTLFKKNIKAGSKIGRSKGIDTGFKWITNATIGVE